MWKELEEANGNVSIDISKSLYVGDAAGRHKTKIRPKKDHSCADRFFASNLGVTFSTPEEFFLGKKTPEPWGPPNFDPVTYLDAKKPLLEPEGKTLPDFVVINVPSK
ncbi:polynucleotide kinase 3 phosphatase [Ancylostoma ceylanicum]|uniref:Polynucleotide kinase 3 phosphatase n=1 Tax=Ancylostoma ceylanicum TaxID=53326 RepID=A0A0D6LLU8_9BILA|nr:polynucleotide kinase 3 phosphatase [Ancylostoma ceylanicum]